MKPTQNPFIVNYMKKFTNKFSSINSKNSKIDENETYEKFINYVLASIEYKKTNYRTFDENFDFNEFIEESHFGKDSAMAVDGCFFIFDTRNDIVSLPALIALPDSPEELENSTKDLKNIHIYLVQTKNGPIDTKTFGALTSCLTAENTHPSWQDFRKAREILETIVHNSERSPNLFFTFLYAANFDANLESADTFQTLKTALEAAMRSFFFGKPSPLI